MSAQYPLIFAVIVLLLMACIRKGDSHKPPETVPWVDLSRYIGTWHEIARYPNNFQKDCRESTATHTLREDGRVTVANRCSRDSGKDEAHATAKLGGHTTNAKLKVTFFWPFYGDYWILELGSDYTYAVVGTPDRKYLWILSRTPEMEATRYNNLLAKIEAQGFEPGRLLKEGKAAKGALSLHSSSPLGRRTFAYRRDSGNKAIFTRIFFPLQNSIRNTPDALFFPATTLSPRRLYQQLIPLLAKTGQPFRYCRTFDISPIVVYSPNRQVRSVLSKAPIHTGTFFL